MEFLVILLSSLIGIVSPVGVVADRLAADAIRDQLEDVESLWVRIDNVPSYQLAQGRVDRVRIAGRGVYPVEGVRLEAVELETGAIALNSSRLRSGEVELERPIQAGIRLVLNQADLAAALQSDEVEDRLQDLNLNALASSEELRDQDYEVVNPQVELLPNQRLRLQFTLQAEDSTDSKDSLAIAAETGLAVQNGQQITLVDPSLSLNNEALPPQIVNFLAGGISRQLNLQNFEKDGISARILQLKIEEEQLAIAGFVQIQPGAIASGN